MILVKFKGLEVEFKMMENEFERAHERGLAGFVVLLFPPAVPAMTISAHHLQVKQQTTSSTEHLSFSLHVLRFEHLVYAYLHC